MSLRVLQPDNTTFNLNYLNQENMKNLRYGVLDYSDTKNVDYFFNPFVMIDQMVVPSADVRIGNYKVQIPLDWHILVGDKEYGDLEIIPLTNLNDRGFSVFCYNPLDGFKPYFLDIEILEIYPDGFWQFPRIKYGCLLLCPLHDQLTIPDKKDGTVGTRGPLNCFVVRDTNKLPEIIDIGKIT